MSLPTTQCEPKLVQLFLTAQLAEPQVMALEEHLSECSACRVELEQLAARDTLWSKAGLYLRDDDDELQPLSSLSSDCGESRTQNVAIRQVLDSLTPTDDPGMLG